MHANRQVHSTNLVWFSKNCFEYDYFVFIDKYNNVNACHVFTKQSTYVTTHETIMKLRHACDEMEINI